jgi:hypothetical protein
MNYFRSILLLALTFVVIASSVETSYAQRRRHRAVVRHDVRVRHKVVVRKAHVRYAHLPRWGAVVATAPVAAVVIKTHPNPYYFHDGVYYTPRQGVYKVVRPARGIRVSALPVGFRRIVVGPRHYFYYYGTFYNQINDTEQYETIDAPVGAVIDALPDGYDIKTIKGEEYYVLDDVIFAEVDAPEFEDGVGYEVIASK